MVISIIRQAFISNILLGNSGTLSVKKGLATSLSDIKYFWEPRKQQHTEKPSLFVWNFLQSLCCPCLWHISTAQHDCSPWDSAYWGISMDMSILRSDCLSKGKGTIKENTISFRAVWQSWASLYITLRMGTFTGRTWRGGNGKSGLMHRAICQIPVMLAEIWLPEIIMEVSCLDPSAHNRERSRTVSC